MDQLARYSGIFTANAHGIELDSTIQLRPDEWVVCFKSPGKILRWYDDLDINLWEIMTSRVCAGATNFERVTNLLKHLKQSNIYSVHTGSEIKLQNSNRAHNTVPELKLSFVEDDDPAWRLGFYALPVTVQTSPGATIDHLRFATPYCRVTSPHIVTKKSVLLSQIITSLRAHRTGFVLLVTACRTFRSRKAGPIPLTGVPADLIKKFSEPGPGEVVVPTLSDKTCAMDTTNDA
jgi:hypothetical protein